VGADGAAELDALFNWKRKDDRKSSNQRRQAAVKAGYNSYRRFWEVAAKYHWKKFYSKVVDIYCALLLFVEKEILYKACLGNKIKAGIEKAIEQLDKRFFGATKRAMITALEDALKRYKKVHKQNSGFGDQRQSQE